MSERIEQDAVPPGYNPLPEEMAVAEANTLMEKIKAGGVANYAEAEHSIAREKFQENVAREAKDRDALRSRWKKWFGVGRADTEVIAVERAKIDDERITSLIANGRVNNVTEAIALLQHLETRVQSSPKEWDLERREISRSKRIKGGDVGSATFVDLKDDGSAVYKPHDKYKGKERIDFINKERAAYLIDRFLGFNFVPPTIVRGLSRGVGSLQEFVADARVGYEVKRTDVPEDEFLKLGLFDMLIVNTDRHEGNYLVKEKKIYAIDHGLALEFGDLKSTQWVSYDADSVLIPAELQAGFRRFAEWPEGQELLRDSLRELFGDQFAGAFLRRVKIFLAAINERGEFSQEQFCQHINELDR